MKKAETVLYLIKKCITPLQNSQPNNISYFFLMNIFKQFYGSYIHK